MRMATVWVSDFVANSFFYVVKDRLRFQVDPELVWTHSSMTASSLFFLDVVVFTLLCVESLQELIMQML